MSSLISTFGLTPTKRATVFHEEGLSAFIDFDMEFVADFQAIYGIDIISLFRTSVSRNLSIMNARGRTGEVEFIYEFRYDDDENSFSITLKEKK